MIRGAAPDLSPVAAPTDRDLFRQVEGARQAVFPEQSEEERRRLGQYGTPAALARFMAAMFADLPPEVRLLDAGAGVGSLAVAFVVEACARPEPPRRISITAVEVEAAFLPSLRANLESCRDHAASQGVDLDFQVVHADFIEMVARAESDLFTARSSPFTSAIQNPPYHKLRSDSRHAALLGALGIQAPNLYAAFVALTARVLAPGGELVAITPRSFCNGPYFRGFRQDLLARTVIRRLHTFESRTEAFSGDAILQENVIIDVLAGRPVPATIEVSSSSGEPGSDMSCHEVAYEKTVGPLPDRVLHIIPDGIALDVMTVASSFPSSLAGLGLGVSTGRVVDFRVREHLRVTPGAGDAPLIYPLHLRAGSVQWPAPGGRKPNAIAVTEETSALLVPAGCYVLLKRFSAKEQPRRIEAFLCDADRLGARPVAFENHVNYIHREHRGLARDLARGLLLYLNSTLVDLYFRSFSGHTQVNAADLRSLPFPDESFLVRLGARLGDEGPTQSMIDAWLRDEIEAMVGDEVIDPVASLRRIREAREVLVALGLPAGQTNDRSALVLLALLGLEADMAWSDARDPLLGVTAAMDWFAARYGKRYAPNSRETIRRKTLHQFCDAGLVVLNPDDPARATNSDKTVYQISPEALELLRHFGRETWAARLDAWLARAPALRELYAQRRDAHRITVEVADGVSVSLSPGGQNVLIEKVVHLFIPRFVPRARILYVGDTEDKSAYLDETGLVELGVAFDVHGKFPDVLVLDTDRNWLHLIEAVTSHGPVDPKRHRELAGLFADLDVGLVFVTAFLDRRGFSRYAPDIAWETEVWIAEAPGHMIHFDGERFRGPYSKR